MIDYISFKNEVLREIETLPDNWRRGQKVFNYIDTMYGVARQVQYIDKVDCFYDDNEIDTFIIAAWMRVTEICKDKRIIKIDVDGVLRDVVKEMCMLYNEKTGENLSPEDVVEYEVDKIFTKINNPRRFFFYDNAERIFGKSEMFDGVKRAIDRLRLLGFRVVLATYQDTVDAKKLTLEWLAKHEINYDAILFTNSTDKSGIMATYVVDDCPDILANEKKDGVIRICVDRPYNRSVDNSEMRVDSLMEFAEHYFYLTVNGKQEDRETEKDRDRIGGSDSNSGGIIQDKK